MKLILSHNECAFLLKDGVFIKLLRAGRHRIFPWLGERALVQPMRGAVDTKEVPAGVLLANDDFSAAVTRVQVPEGHVALHHADGVFEDTVPPGDHLYWSVHQRHSFRLISMEDPAEGTDLPAAVLSKLPANLVHKVEVSDGKTALLYFDNRFQRALPPGVYFFWTGVHQVTHVLYDLRVQQLEVSGQEILTADKVAVRLNLVCRYRITDPLALSAHVQDFPSQLYTAVQLAARAYIGRRRLDEALADKDAVADAIRGKLQERRGELFAEFDEVGVKDIILPGEIREIMNTVLIAEKKAQANVIARREEVASTRSLLNTARLMDENRTLYQLKELECLERICAGVGSIHLTGAGSVLEQLGKLIGTPETSCPPRETRQTESTQV